MSNEVKIPISLPGAAQASADAAKVASGLDGVAAAAKKGGKASEEQAKGAAAAGKEILSLGETTEKGIGIGRMFSEVLQGNFYALGNVTAALKVTGAALKTSVVGVALLALTALANFLPTLIDKLKGSKDSLSEGFDAARAAGERLNQAKLSTLQTELQAIKDLAGGARTALEETQAAADKLDDAEMAAQLAENKVAPGLTQEERDANERAIRGKFAEYKRARKLGGMQDQETGALSEVQQIAGVVAAKGAEVADLRNRVETAQNRRSNLGESIRGLELEQQGLSRVSGGTPQEMRQRGIRSIEIDTELRALRAERKSLEDPLAIEKEKRERDALTARTGEFSSAQRDLMGGLGRYEAIMGRNYRERAVMELLGGTGGPISREDYAKRHNAVMDTRSEPDPTFKAENRAIDAASLRAAAGEAGQKTGADLARMMREAIEANNAAILRKVEADLATTGARAEQLARAARR